MRKLLEKIYNYIPKQLFLYALCGGGNMVFDWILYFLVYHYVVGKELVYLSAFDIQLCLTPHIATLCIVFPITLLTGFLLQKYVTFTTSQLHSLRQLVRYSTVVAINLAINYFGLKLCVEIWGWYPTPSKMFITIITFAVSYFGQKYYSFRTSRSKK